MSVFACPQRTVTSPPVTVIVLCTGTRPTGRSR